ncbi:hypothetical protein EGW08_018859 [Elysia chlorotica]|uniref:Uncharacterized protein n=1 Tax=Elysia chlorotica TaxID=188477 RepID=A0A3S0ZEW9_ELYCH|nr:hypothetical protein EGW08_018859 [Elysia chlorotica]
MNSSNHRSSSIFTTRSKVFLQDCKFYDGKPHQAKIDDTWLVDKGKYDVRYSDIERRSKIVELRHALENYSQAQIEEETEDTALEDTIEEAYSYREKQLEEAIGITGDAEPISDKTMGNRIDCTCGKDKSMKQIKMCSISYGELNVKVKGCLHLSKRSVLNCIACIFVHLGFAAPFTITAKFLLQELWVLGIGWDEELPDPLKGRFDKRPEDFHTSQE